MKTHESAENYLETILILSHRKPEVHSIDIANELDFSKPSVSVAMKNLRQKGYITIDAENHIHLTPSGLEIAETIYERHTLISEWLIRLGVSEKTAVEDACRIEHVISAESFAAIKRHTTGTNAAKGAPQGTSQETETP
ncbi:MAG TPA: metal-dependent transcriptional regulator [Firmicutes bacterium]|nr:metal-dependent transcriptional regulator [Bacillota bacterium]